jgi:hypothetical protein
MDHIQRSAIARGSDSSIEPLTWNPESTLWRASFEESVGDGVAIAAPRWERAQRVNRLRAPVLATQGTSTGRGIIARISLQAMSHISLAMMAGSQNNIGMVNLPCGVTLQRRSAFQCSQSFQDL